jgi:TonB family protein
MKKIFFIISLLIHSLLSFSQEINFDVSGSYTNAITSEKLIAAKSLNDIIPYYPKNWLTNLICVDILANRNGKTDKYVSSNKILTPQQLSVFQAVDLGSDVVINVMYQRKNTVTELLLVHNLNYKATVIPETEAMFDGGMVQLKKYLKENVINNIPAEIAKNIKAAKVNFTINEKGQPINIVLVNSSEDKKTDDLMLQVIKNMPKWQAAKNAKGINVSQNFQFNVGMNGC